MKLVCEFFSSPGVSSYSLGSQDCCGRRRAPGSGSFS
uniref:p14 protein n=1 Tax=Little cherry virus 2 TaxID=154339 RepID=A0A517BBC3_9CLOS|nr:p14 protein [Little cherry virus 2]